MNETVTLSKTKYKNLLKELADKDKMLIDKDKDIFKLKEQVLLYRKMCFGYKREKTSTLFTDDSVSNEQQFSLFDDEFFDKLLSYTGRAGLSKIAGQNDKYYRIDFTLRARCKIKVIVIGFVERRINLCCLLESFQIYVRCLQRLFVIMLK